VAVVTGASARETAAAAARDLAKLPNRPEGILVESDFAAVSLIEELQRAGLRVPEDVAVIGCGNAEEGFHCHPRLTTIGPTELSFVEPANHLIDLVESREPADGRRFGISWQLLVRESAS
jgi:LacI family repressor for deo operon, udp, cdd, tsx, nupC, and nupG